MPDRQLGSNGALSFAQGWIARNIEVGPFSWKDGQLYDGPISAFRRAATQAGFDDTELERGVGSVPEFIANAYANAIRDWQAAQKSGDHVK